MYYLLTRGYKVLSDDVMDYFSKHKDTDASPATIYRDIRFFKENFDCEVTSSRYGTEIKSELTFIKQLDLLL